jgi:hypothetical protein
VDGTAHALNHLRQQQQQQQWCETAPWW